MVNRNVVRADISVDGSSDIFTIYPGQNVKVNKGSKVNVIFYPSSADDDSIDDTLIPTQENYNLVGDIENNKIVLPKTLDFYQRGKYYVKINPTIEDKADIFILDHIIQNYTFYIEKSINKRDWEDAEMPYEISRVPDLQNSICLIIGDDGSSEIFLPNEYYYRIRVESNDVSTEFDYNCVPEYRRFTASELENLDGTSVFTVNLEETIRQANGTINVKVTDNRLSELKQGYVQVKVFINGEWVPDESLDGSDPDKLWPAAYNGEDTVNVLLDSLLIGYDYRIFFYDDKNKTNERYYDYTPTLDDMGTLINLEGIVIEPIVLNDNASITNLVSGILEDNEEALKYGHALYITSLDAIEYKAIRTNEYVSYNNFELNESEVRDLYDFSELDYPVLGGFYRNSNDVYAIVEADGYTTIIEIVFDDRIAAWIMINILNSQ